VVSEIAAASAEQSAGIDQVNRAITHIDEMTQQNAALVEESSASARSLEEQAESLVDLVNFFKIENSGSTKGNAGKKKSASKAESKSSNTAPKVKVIAPASTSSSKDDDDWEEF
ncbi:MAG: hypothetical protein R3261_11955, partial [Alphaproteobacteria bacterium]|nr:hypothetical protein [Alphaproteobacteria bacterium]